MKFSEQVDLLKISIKNFIPESTGTPPSAPGDGQMYYDTGLSKIRAYLAAGWRNLVDERRAVNSGTGLTGGGDLSADRTLAVDFAADNGGTANQAVRANDTRLSNSRTPSGAAGGDLTGTYPNPTVASDKITLAKINSAVKSTADGGTAADTDPAVRRLGYVSGTALPGNASITSIIANTPVTGPVDLNNNRITTMADPVNPTDGANKRYVDQRVQGAEWKDSVRLVATSSIPLSGLAAIDGVTPVAGDRVLAISQTTSSQNGIYVAASGAWARSSDADTAGELTPNTAVFVEEGAVNADTGWTLTTNGTITIGTTAQTWTQFTGVGAIIAGAGLTKSGNSIDVVAADGTIVVSPDSIGVGLVGTDKGGTGATNVGNAATNLGFLRSFGPVTLTAALSAGTWTSLNSLGALPSGAVQDSLFIRVVEISTGELIHLGERFDPGAQGVDFQIKSDIAWAANTLKVIVHYKTA